MPTTKIFTVVLAAATFACASVILAPAMAQQAPAEVSETELDDFVGAYRDVVAIEQNYEQQLQVASDDTKRQEIIDEAQVEMTQAVEDAPGIDVDRYVEILRLAQNDSELQANLTSRLQN